MMVGEHNVYDAQKLVFLGLCGGAIPISAEIAAETMGCKAFDIVKNTDVKDSGRPYMWPEFKFSIYSHEDYNFKQVGLRTYFGVNTPHIKYILYRFFNEKYGVETSNYVNLISPTSCISISSSHENALLLECVSVISSFTSVGFGVTIKRNCSVGHHVQIDDYVSIYPGVNISSGVHIGEGTMLGVGSTIIDGIKIGKHSFIGAGSLVTKNIPDGVVAYGNPCKVVRQNDIWEKAFDRLASI